MAILRLKITYADRKDDPNPLRYDRWRVRWERFDAGEWQEVSVTDHPFRTPHADFKGQPSPGLYRASIALTNGADVSEECYSDTFRVSESDMLAVALGEA